MKSNDDFENFVTLHRPQLSSSGIPEHFWETLHKKLNASTFDAGENFIVVEIEEVNNDNFHNKWKVLVTTSGGIRASDSTHIYLIDHAWTFRPDQVRKHLMTNTGLLERMANLVGVKYNDSDDGFKETVNEVMGSIWKYSQTYSIGNQSIEAENRVPIWYIMDEFGSRIQHSDQPSVRIVPFFSLSEGATYSVMFPVADLNENQEITRDFLEGFLDDNVSRSALLIPWSSRFYELSFETEGFQHIEPKSDYFVANRVMESLPAEGTVVLELPTDRPIRTYVEYTFIKDYLKHPRFHLVDDPDLAEILWLSTHFKDYKGLSEHFPFKRVNQFPREHILTVKDLLCVVARRSFQGQSHICEETLDGKPEWLPVTFNLKSELPAFVKFYETRKKLGLKNYWIVKPWNLARSLDTHITENLDMILRLATSGPKICQKYIDRPVLFYREDLSSRVKFDLRYIVLLSSVKPLKAYVYERFWLRFANKPFELDEFDEYERHFTVMNYSATQLHQMFCHEFIDQFQQQNPDQMWGVIEEKIFSMLSSLLKAAVNGDTNSCLASSPQSRAMYAVDIMLSWRNSTVGNSSDQYIQPMLLEVNWAPDCKRACAYYPEFFDDVFSVLFLDETEGKHVRLLQ